MTTSTKYVQQYRARKREGRLLLPRIEVDADIIDTLVDANFLKQWDDQNPEAIADAVVRLLRSIGNDIP